MRNRFKDDPCDDTDAIVPQSLTIPVNINGPFQNTANDRDPPHEGVKSQKAFDQQERISMPDARLWYQRGPELRDL
jgi:hypothetical protein